jgi:uncharacterized membrane protein
MDRSRTRRRERTLCPLQLLPRAQQEVVMAGRNYAIHTTLEARASLVALMMLLRWTYLLIKACACRIDHLIVFHCVVLLNLFSIIILYCVETLFCLIFLAHGFLAHMFFFPGYKAQHYY